MELTTGYVFAYTNRARILVFANIETIINTGLPKNPSRQK